MLASARTIHALRTCTWRSSMKTAKVIMATLGLQKVKNSSMSSSVEAESAAAAAKPL